MSNKSKAYQMDILNIRFRPMDSGDFDQIAEWLSDENDIALFDRGLPVPVGKGYVQESWKSAVEFNEPPRALWFIVENDNNEAIGMCGLQAINYIHGDAIVPLFVHRDHRQKGLGHSMILFIVDMAFNKLRLHRLSTVFRSDNLASQAIVKVAGFQQEGRARQAWFGDGEFQDIIHVGLLASEWGNFKPAVEERVAASPFVIKRTAHKAE